MACRYSSVKRSRSISCWLWYRCWDTRLAVSVRETILGVGWMGLNDSLTREMFGVFGDDCCFEICTFVFLFNRRSSGFRPQQRRRKATILLAIHYFKSLSSNRMRARSCLFCKDEIKRHSSLRWVSLEKFMFYPQQKSFVYSSRLQRHEGKTTSKRLLSRIQRTFVVL